MEKTGSAATPEAAPGAEGQQAQPMGIPPVEDVEIRDGTEPAKEEQQAQEPKEEVDLPAEPAEPEDPLARARQDLERRDRELLERGAKVKAYEQQLKEYQELRDTARRDPLAAARALGLDPLTLAEMHLTGKPEEQKPTPDVDGVKAELQALKQQVQETQRAAAVKTEMQRLQGFVDPEKHPVLAALNKEGTDVAQQIYDIAAAHYQRTAAASVDGTGELPDIAQVVAQLEENQTKAIFDRLAAAVAVPSIKDRMMQHLGLSQQPATKPAIQGTQKAITSTMEGEAGREARVPTAEEAEMEALEILMGKTQ